PLLLWAEREDTAYMRSAIRLAIRLLPLVTTLVLGLYAFGVLPWQLPFVLLATHVVLITIKGKEHGRVLSLLYLQEEHLEAYARMLKYFEEHHFEAEWLRERQARLRDAQ